MEAEGGEGGAAAAETLRREPAPEAAEAAEAEADLAAETEAEAGVEADSEPQIALEFAVQRLLPSVQLCDAFLALMSPNPQRPDDVFRWPLNIRVGERGRERQRRLKKRLKETQRELN